MFAKQIGGRGFLTTERRGLYDYLKESKEHMLRRALKENVIKEGETKEEFTKRKRNERKKTLHEGKLQGQFAEENQENCTQVFRKVDKEWV